MLYVILSCFLIFAAALLYSSVGHAGASGYLAIMALFGMAPEVMKPAALILNVLVASVAALRFYRAGCFSWPVFLPFAVGSIPLAFLGGSMSLPGPIYKQAVGVVLLFSAYRLFRTAGHATPPARPVSPIPATVSGAGIGFLSGVTGVGGGIFLTPLLVFLGWAEMRTAAGVSAAFILVNSVAGIGGHLLSIKTVPAALGYWAVAAVLGGAIGSHIGVRRLGDKALRQLLGIVLVIAGGKLIFT